jgi:hypothetical protein
MKWAWDEHGWERWDEQGMNTLGRKEMGMI